MESVLDLAITTLTMLAFSACTHVGYTSLNESLVELSTTPRKGDECNCDPGVTIPGYVVNDAQ